MWSNQYGELISHKFTYNKVEYICGTFRQ
uniref:Uncharacterized protein n=1 Tax=Arundo donax TaxID=35708 RepID=A0A0A9HB91_ARUDO